MVTTLALVPLSSSEILAVQKLKLSSRKMAPWKVSKGKADF